MDNPAVFHSHIEALNDAVRAITADLSLDRMLRRLAEITAHLVSARYAALGVPDERGGLEAFFTYGMTDRQISLMDHYPLGQGLLGALLSEQLAIRLDDMQADSRSTGFCPAHPKMNSFLGVPIMSKGRLLGSLYLCDRIDHQPFSAEDERLVEMLAGHAAIAIENAKLSDQLRKLTIIEERDRIGMELHDGIIQDIYAIGMKLELAQRTNAISPEMSAHLSSTGQDLNHIIEDIRRYIQGLKVGVGYTLNLQDQIREIVEVFQAVSSAQLTLDIAPGFTILTEDKLHALTQISREALSNIARHANASQVHFKLSEEHGHMTLIISDDGGGFDLTSASAGHGLQNMRRRALQLGGTLTITSTAQGTSLLLSLPG